MKRWLAVPLAALLLAASAAWSRADDEKPEVRINLDEQPAPAAPKAAAKPGTAKALPPAAPAKKAAPAAAGAKAKAAAKPAAKKAEPPAKIDGLAIPRKTGGGFLGLKIDQGVFVLSFYDADKKPMPADASRAVLRWPVHYQPNDERTQLEPVGDGKSMSSPKIVRPPFTFKLYLTLLKDAAPNEPVATEDYIVDFQQ